MIRDTETLFREHDTGAIGPGGQHESEIVLKIGQLVEKVAGGKRGSGDYDQDKRGVSDSGRERGNGK